MNKNLIKPRNTLVVLRIASKKEEKIGNIVVTELDELYSEAEVLAVGPGMVASAGGIAETFDLKVGQRVLVKAKNKDPRFGNTVAGIQYTHNGEILHIFEQGSIIGIIAEPGEYLGLTPDMKPGEKSKVLLA